MSKHDPEELRQIHDELEDVFRSHRDVLNDEPRISRPIREAAEAAKVKYEDVTRKSVRAEQF